MALIGPDGSAELVFAGLQVEDTVVACWTSDTREGPWFSIATDVTYGLSCLATNVGPDLVIEIIGALPGWWFLATVAAAE
jgi:hypothetical protein